MTRKPSFDYIIVGAGSAGCVLASRLSADPHVRVLVIEAGGSDRDPWIQIPLGWGKLYTGKAYDWHYETVPERALDNRTVEFARGKVIGGCSSINAMAYVRGHRSDYDRWAASGLDGWSYADALPYFRRQERWEGGESAYRGGDGPLATQASKYEDPLVDAAISAGMDTGLPRTADYNGAQQEGVGLIQSTILNGRRCSAANAYLHPARGRANLSVITRAQVIGLDFDGKRCVGLRYVKNGKTETVRADREVILSGGVASSPHLLMLAGLGDPEVLAMAGIRTRIDLPGVGRNLQDHISPIVHFGRKENGPFHKAMRYDRVALSLAEAYLRGTGIASDVPCGLIGFIKSEAGLDAPDLQILLNAAPLTAKPYLTERGGSFQDGFGFRVVLLRPTSRGRITAISDDPLVQPRIHQNFLTDPEEWRVLRRGIRLIRDLASRPSMSMFNSGEIVPDEIAGDTDDALDRFIRQKALTTHHPLGTCKMGPDGDEMAVVDSQFRVRGINNLRIVDASVMPDMVGGNINAPVIMIAERAADLILGKPVLSPLSVTSAAHGPSAAHGAIPKVAATA